MSTSRPRKRPPTSPDPPSHPFGRPARPGRGPHPLLRYRALRLGHPAARAAGLIDELHLLVHPIAVGRGVRLFEEGVGPIRLKLLSSTAFASVVLNTVHGPADR
ncbi:dihydrofolate reductase family protein [Kitasatospora purpeofusca]|uniref:dihydrofolate reductase family protein n=1 Tax=Kitasatospora purpeofusca TaxID=67352 RepID=UPI0036EC2B31